MYLIVQHIQILSIGYLKLMKKKKISFLFWKLVPLFLVTSIVIFIIENHAMAHWKIMPLGTVEFHVELISQHLEEFKSSCGYYPKTHQELLIALSDKPYPESSEK